MADLGPWVKKEEDLVVCWGEDPLVCWGEDLRPAHAHRVPPYPRHPASGAVVVLASWEKTEATDLASWERKGAGLVVCWAQDPALSHAHHEPPHPRCPWSGEAADLALWKEAPGLAFWEEVMVADLGPWAKKGAGLVARWDQDLSLSRAHRELPPDPWGDEAVEEAVFAVAMVMGDGLVEEEEEEDPGHQDPWSQPVMHKVVVSNFKERDSLEGIP